MKVKLLFDFKQGMTCRPKLVKILSHNELGYDEWWAVITFLYDAFLHVDCWGYYGDEDESKVDHPLIAEMEVHFV